MSSRAERLVIGMTGRSGTLGSEFGWISQQVSYRDFLVLDRTQQAKSLQGLDVLIHAAAIVGADRCQANLRRAMWVNAYSIEELVRAASDAGVKRSVLISSSHVYGGGSGRFSEAAPLRPIGAYAISKATAESVFFEACSKFGHQGSVFRMFSILGDRAQPGTLGSALADAVTSRSGRILNPQDVRDFYTPKQVSEILESIIAHPQLPEVVNVCSGVGTSVFEAARIFLNSFGLGTDIVDFEQVNPPSSIVGNSELLSGILGSPPPVFRFEKSV